MFNVHIELIYSLVGNCITFQNTSVIYSHVPMMTATNLIFGIDI